MGVSPAEILYCIHAVHRDNLNNLPLFQVWRYTKGIGTGNALIGDSVLYHQLPAALSYTKITTPAQEQASLGITTTLRDRPGLLQ